MIQPLEFVIVAIWIICLAFSVAKTDEPSPCPDRTLIQAVKKLLSLKVRESNFF
jgi:hypothetical protein